MGKNMSDRERLSVLRQLRNVFPYRIVETQLSILGQQDDRSRRELFGYGAGLEDRLRRVWNVVFHFGETECFLEQRLTIQRNADRASRCRRRRIDLRRFLECPFGTGDDFVFVGNLCKRGEWK